MVKNGSQTFNKPNPLLKELRDLEKEIAKMEKELGKRAEATAKAKPKTRQGLV